MTGTLFPADTITLFTRWLLLIALFSTAQFSGYLPLELYFGIHFICTEIYIKECNHQSGISRLFHLFTATGMYGVMINQSPVIKIIPLEFFYVLFFSGLFCALFVKYIFKVQSMNAWSWFFVLYEITGLVCASAFSLFGYALIESALFYHIVWWALYPLYGTIIGKVRNNFFLKYLLISVAVNILFGLLIFIPIANSRMFLLENIILFGNLHITISFALSSGQPAFINTFFGRIIKKS
ncbi:MAG TPA: hypothetical protein PKA63_07495 [Oligoflexia bacterium]|nr:hypothetical protein [Oligoflexia bacterium]HMP48493.1 hypothetical protein [Oligoflexia bacterium]